MLRELRALLPYLTHYRWQYAGGSLCILASVAFKLLIPYLLGDSIDTLRTVADQRTALDGTSVTPLIARAVLTIMVASVAVAITRTVSRIWILGSSRRVVHDVRNVVFDHLLRLAPSFYIRNTTGQIMSRAVNDMQNVQGLMGPVIMYLAETATLFAIGITVMLRIHPQLTLVAMAPFPFFLVAARKIAVRIQEGSRDAQDSLAEVSAKVDESLSGQLVIKTLVIEEFDRQRFLEHCQKYRRLTLEITRHRSILVPMMMALTSLSTVVVLGVGGPQVTRGSMSLGALVTMILYLQMLAGPTRTLGFVISSLRRGASALARIREILEAPVTLRDAPGALPLAGTGGVEIRVDDLSVAYPSPLAGDGGEPSERRVLDRVSLTIPAGHTLGVVGHVGSGKTTLVRVLARQLEVDPDHVFFDGVDITRIQLESVRRAIGLVPQDAFLFSASLADNVALGAPDSDSARIDGAVHSAQLGRDVPQLPEGLDTIVGERGVNLSGGQRQRTALARVLLLDPRLLILDDTLSAVDTDTADAILAELRQFSRQRTTVIVSHRLSTLLHADEIIVLDEGRVIERGSHDDLLRKDGHYADLYRQQEQQEEQRARQDALRRQLEAGNGSTRRVS